MKIFIHILANNTLAGITNFTVWFALIFYVYLQTKSVLATSIISGMYLVATAVSGFWLGSIVDHYKKKQVMLLSSYISLTSYLLGFILYVFAGSSSFTFLTSGTLWVFVSLLLIGIIAGNLRTIALPTVVTLLFAEDRRDKANGLIGTAGGVAFLFTSVMSGVLVGYSGMYHVLLLATGITVCTIVDLWFVVIHEDKIIHLHQSPELDSGSNTGVHSVDIKGTIKAISKVPGLFALIFFTTFNNFLGGVFMALMDAYGLSLVSVQVWGFLWGFLSTAFIIGGLIIAKWGLGHNPLRSFFIANCIIWCICSVFTIPGSIVVLVAGMYIYLCVVPYIEASEHTIIQKVVPHERQGRVFGFAQSVEQAASPLTAFFIGPITQFIFIPFMTTGAGVKLIGYWFGTGADRGIALVFTLTGIVGLCITLVARNSQYYTILSHRYLQKET